MRRLMGSTKNFGEYRESLHLANPPCIPFFGKFISSHFITSPYSSRCLSHRSYVYWRWNPIPHQEICTDQLRQTSQNSWSYSWYPTVPERALSLAASPRTARIYIKQYASGWRCTWDVWEELTGRATWTRGWKDRKVCQTGFGIALWGFHKLCCIRNVLFWKNKHEILANSYFLFQNKLSGMRGRL